MVKLYKTNDVVDFCVKNIHWVFVMFGLIMLFLSLLLFWMFSIFGIVFIALSIYQLYEKWCYMIGLKSVKNGISVYDTNNNEWHFFNNISSIDKSSEVYHDGPWSTTLPTIVLKSNDGHEHTSYFTSETMRDNVYQVLSDMG